MSKSGGLQRRSSRSPSNQASRNLYLS